MGKSPNKDERSAAAAFLLALKARKIENSTVFDLLESTIPFVNFEPFLF